MTDKESRGWFADIDPEQPEGAYRWQPVLQTDGVVPSFEMWFATEDACLEWIREQVIGHGMIYTPEALTTPPVGASTIPKDPTQ